MGEVGDYEWMTYAEMFNRINNLGSGLACLQNGLGLGEQTAIGMYSMNRPEWNLAMYAAFRCNAYVVPLYDTLGDDAIQYIFNKTDTKIIVASGNKVEKLLSLIGRIEHLKTIISMDPIPANIIDGAKEKGIEIITFKEVEELGQREPVDAKKPKASDLCSICFTSGTTAMPKGVMLPHSVPTAIVASLFAISKQSYLTKTEDYFYSTMPKVGEVFISYLPLAHAFEFAATHTNLCAGASIGYSQGDILKLVDDFAALRPTMIIAVPRVISRICDKVQATVESSGLIKRTIFNYAVKCKVERLRRTGDHTHWFWDRVLAPVRAKMGGRLKAVLIGAAPISEDLIEKFSVMFNAFANIGYGMTESCGAITAPTQGEIEGSGCGAPVPSIQVKLVDIPEMNYHSTDKPFPRGEICYKGFNCFTGYYQDDENTKAVIDEEGWIHSGDVARFDEFGRVHIIDRKKNIFKLAQGEYVATEKIESILIKSPYIAQAFIEGDSIRAVLVAIIVPDMEMVQQWAVKNGISAKCLTELAADPKVKSLIVNEIAKFGKNGSGELKGFELPANIFLESNAFSIEENLLTPTMKLKRFSARLKYKDVIEELYAEIDRKR